jgi:hypothetical protein
VRGAKKSRVSEWIVRKTMKNVASKRREKRAREFDVFNMEHDKRVERCGVFNRERDKYE